MGIKKKFEKEACGFEARGWSLGRRASRAKPSGLPGVHASAYTWVAKHGAVWGQAGEMLAHEGGGEGGDVSRVRRVDFALPRRPGHL